MNNWTPTGGPDGRLPEESGKYIVTLESVQTGARMIVLTEYDRSGFAAGFLAGRNWRVTAWAKAPEPYKE